MVALKDNTVVGHLLFSPIVIEGDSGALQGMALGPMAVLPEFQRQGVGSELTQLRQFQLILRKIEVGGSRK
jgi:predicted N-acetyltransferase YhbS